jgi:hypothetical protein
MQISDDWFLFFVGAAISTTRVLAVIAASLIFLGA